MPLCEKQKIRYKERCRTMKTITDIPYSDIGHKNQVLDIFLPESDNFPVFVYFHGGGLEAGNHHNKPFIGDLVKRGIAVVSVQYRLYPTAKYPEFIMDAAASVAWTMNNIGKYGKCEKFYIGGSSAGAYLSMMLCFDKRWLAPYKIEPADITGYIHDAGQPTKHFNVCREEGLDSRRVIIDETAPIFHIGTSAEYAPMIFIVSDDDMENRYEQTLLMVNTLKHFEYDMSKIKLKVTHGGHCISLQMNDENGCNVFAKTVYDFMEEYK